MDAKLILENFIGFLIMCGFFFIYWILNISVYKFMINEETHDKIVDGFFRYFKRFVYFLESLFAIGLLSCFMVEFNQVVFYNGLNKIQVFVIVGTVEVIRQYITIDMIIKENKKNGEENDRKF